MNGKARVGYFDYDIQPPTLRALKGAKIKNVYSLESLEEVKGFDITIIHASDEMYVTILKQSSPKSVLIRVATHGRVGEKHSIIDGVYVLNIQTRRLELSAADFSTLVRELSRKEAAEEVIAGTPPPLLIPFLGTCEPTFMVSLALVLQGYLIAHWEKNIQGDKIEEAILDMGWGCTSDEVRNKLNPKLDYQDSKEIVVNPKWDAWGCLREAGMTEESVKREWAGFEGTSNSSSNILDFVKLIEASDSKAPIDNVELAAQAYLELSKVLGEPK